MDRKILAIVQKGLQLDNEVIERIANYFDSHEKVYPFELAEKFKVNYKKTLQIFAVLVREEYLVKRYRFFCPSCNNMQEETLPELEVSEHTVTCSMTVHISIRAYLQTPVISNQYLPLDGILYAALTRKTLGEKLISKASESNVRACIGITLPLKKGGQKNEMWFYHCSFAQWSHDVKEDTSFKVKQGDWLRHDSYLKGTKQIDTSRGKYKNYQLKFYYRAASFVEWYCIGNPIDIAELLNHCTGIGKNTGDGWGQVLRWEIKDWQEDWSVRGPGNKLMRAVPLPDQKGRGFVYGLRPSYWNPRHQFLCKMPD